MAHDDQPPKAPTPPAEAPAAPAAPAPPQPHDPLGLPAEGPKRPPHFTATHAPPPVHGDRRAREMGWRSRDVLRTATLIAALWVGLKLVWLAHPLLLTAFLGVLFGLAVTAGVDRLQRWHVPRGLGAPIVVLGTLGIIVGVLAWTAPVLRAQSRELRTKLPEAVDKFDDWLERHRGGVLGLILGESGEVGAPAAAKAITGADSSRGADSVRGPIERAAQRTADQSNAPAAPTAGDQPTAPQAQPAGGTTDALRDSTSATSQLKRRLFAGARGAQQYLFGFLTSTFAVVGGLLIIIFISIYVGSDPDLYHNGLMHLFPHGTRKRAGEVLTAIATALRKWLVTQLIAMLVIGGVTTVVLLVLRVKAALPLGILAGLFEFIPTVGPILSALPALAMGFVDSPQKALLVGVAYIGIQFLENHILIPMLMRQGVDIPPVLTILAQALMAMVFGFLGLLVAVPLLAAAMVAVKMLYVEDVVGDPIDVLDVGPDEGA